MPQSTSRNYSQPIATSTHCIKVSTSNISSVLSAANMRQRWRQHQCRRRINSSTPRVLCNNIGQGNIDGHGSCAIICTINQYTITIRSIKIQWIYNLLIYEWCTIDHIWSIYDWLIYEWYTIDQYTIDIWSIYNWLIRPTIDVQSTTYHHSSSYDNVDGLYTMTAAYLWQQRWHICGDQSIR